MLELYKKQINTMWKKKKSKSSTECNSMKVYFIHEVRVGGYWGLSQLISRKGWVHLGQVTRPDSGHWT